MKKPKEKDDGQRKKQEEKMRKGIRSRLERIDKTEFKDILR